MLSRPFMALRFPHGSEWPRKHATPAECLDHFVILGEKHLRYLLKEYLAHYHTERPHQGLDNEPLGGLPDTAKPVTLSLADLHCHERLGGLLKSYSSRAGCHAFAANQYLLEKRKSKMGRESMMSF